MSTRFRATLLLPVLLSFVLVSPPLEAEIDPRCEPSAEAAAAIAETIEIFRVCGPSADCARQRLAVAEAALDGEPDDLFLHRLVQDVWTSSQPLGRQVPEERAAMVAGYQRRAAERPGDPALQYLAARAVSDQEAGETRAQLFARLLELDPTFPWARVGALRYESDEALRLAHAEAFVDACPSRLLSVSTALRELEGDEALRARIEAARPALAELPPVLSLERYPSFWLTWFEVTPLAEHGEVERAVRQDLARIETLDLVDQRPWWQALDRGYGLLSDDEAIDRLFRRRAEHQPCDIDVTSGRGVRWYDEHPVPPSGDRAAEVAHSRALWEAAGGWLATCPDAPAYWLVRLFAVADLPEVPDETVLDLADRILHHVETEGPLTDPPIELEIAELYLDRGLRLDRVEGLAHRGTELSLETLDGVLEQSNLTPEDRRRIEATKPFLQRTRPWLTGQAALAQGNLDAARERLADLEALTDAVRPTDDAPADEELIAAAVEGTAWRLRSEIALAEGQPLDAALFGARAAVLLPPEETSAEELAALRDTWVEGGGSEAGWQATVEGFRRGFADSGPDRVVAAWDEVATPLPEFTSADLAGETWQLEDFRGKTVFANLWATWCGWCRVELPEVEKLHRRFAGRDDILVVTLNLDTQESMALRYAERQGFTVPVLLAADWVEGLDRVSGLPVSWIIDAEGVIRHEQSGYSESEGWVDGVAEMLEHVASGAEELNR